MGRVKTSKKQKPFSIKDLKPVKLKNRKGLKEHDPSETLQDKDFIAEALTECILDGDFEGFKEVLSAHLESVNKAKLADDSGVSIRAIHKALSDEGNPSLKTVCKIFKGLKTSA